MSLSTRQHARKEMQRKGPSCRGAHGIEMEVTPLHQVTPEEAEAHLGELIKAALEGETVIITQDAKHQVQLVPIARNTHDRVAGSGKGTFTMSDDFDVPLPEFEEYEPGK
jgi:antitoxin (DNA-binding transcriptional repressor) of toxin-antitoxin stability system